MNAREDKGVIMVFARAPVPGETKTRLIPALGARGAACLHAELIDRTLAKVTAIDDASIALWCTPSIEDAFLQSRAKQYGIPLYAQYGDDLGRRMAHAFETTLLSAPWAIVLGTDCPELMTCDVQQAIDELRRGIDAVAGPAFDGGYYLLGLRRASPYIFEEMPWGTDQVWALSEERLGSLGWSWSITRTHHDLDRPEDLDYFPNLLHSACGNARLGIHNEPL